jgi:hypothetical protein
LDGLFQVKSISNRLLGGEVKPYAIGGAALGMSYYFLKAFTNTYYSGTTQGKYRLNHAILGLMVNLMYFNPYFMMRSMVFGAICGDILYLRDHEIYKPNGFYHQFEPLAPEDKVNIE